MRDLSLIDAVIRAPASLRLLSGRAWVAFVVYLSSCAVLLGMTAALLISYKDDLRGLVLDYLFPGQWQSTVDLLVDFFLQRQLRGVVINAAIGGSLVLVTVMLFPVKEWLSSRFEKDAHLTEEPIEELPLWFQGWEEIKLFLLFIAVQGSIFWIGYPPTPWRKHLALVLSYLFLFYTFAIDFISPVLQRHRGRFSMIIKSLCKRPLSALAFGAVFSLPPIICGQIWEANPDWSFATAIVVLFAANVLSIAWAAVAGTWLGARWFDHFRGTKQSNIAFRVLAWLALLGLLAGNAYAYGAVTVSLHHKSQILKLKYSVDFSSVGFDRPSVTSLLARRLDVGVHVDITIENPTPFDVDLEDNRLEIKHEGTLVAQTSLSPVTIPAGTTQRQEITFTLQLTLASLKKGVDLFTQNGWDIVLYLEVGDDFWFPVYMLTDLG